MTNTSSSMFLGALTGLDDFESTMLPVLTVGIPVIYLIDAGVLFGFGYNLDKQRLQETSPH